MPLNTPPTDGRGRWQRKTSHDEPEAFHQVGAIATPNLVQAPPGQAHDGDRRRAHAARRHDALRPRGEDHRLVRGPRRALQGLPGAVCLVDVRSRACRGQ